MDLIIRICNNRNFIKSKRLSHIVWDEHNPNNPWKRGLIVHHKDKDPLNDNISNLQLMSYSEHRKIHVQDFDFSGENNSMYGKHHTEEAREKISKARKEKYSGKNHPMYGTHRSKETKRKLSEFRMGMKHTEEAKTKIAAAGRKRKQTTQQKEKISKFMKQWWSERRLS